MIADAMKFFTVKQIKTILFHQFTISLSNTLIGTILKEFHYKYAQLTKVPKLEPYQMEARKKFAAFWLLHRDLIKHIFYSDESKKSVQSEHFVTWIRIDIPNLNEVEKYATGQMFFCVIGKISKVTFTLFQIQKTVLSTKKF